MNFTYDLNIENEITVARLFSTLSWNTYIQNFGHILVHFLKLHETNLSEHVYVSGPCFNVLYILSEKNKNEATRI